jgi:hypothetical protein
MLKSWLARVVVFAAGVTMAAATLASPAAAANPDRCKSVNGVVIYQFGNTTCASTASTESTPNVAMATGNGAYAYAETGNGNKAKANGVAAAYGYNGDGNKGTAKRR